MEICSLLRSMRPIKLMKSKRSRRKRIKLQFLSQLIPLQTLLAPFFLFPMAPFCIELNLQGFFLALIIAMVLLLLCSIPRPRRQFVVLHHHWWPCLNTDRWYGFDFFKTPESTWASFNIFSCFIVRIVVIIDKALNAFVFHLFTKRANVAGDEKGLLQTISQGKSAYHQKKTKIFRSNCFWSVQFLMYDRNARLGFFFRNKRNPYARNLKVLRW